MPKLRHLTKKRSARLGTLKLLLMKDSSGTQTIAKAIVTGEICDADLILLNEQAFTSSNYRQLDPNAPSKIDDKIDDFINTLIPYMSERNLFALNDRLCVIEVGIRDQKAFRSSTLARGLLRYEAQRMNAVANPNTLHHLKKHLVPFFEGVDSTKSEEKLFNFIDFLFFKATQITQAAGAPSSTADDVTQQVLEFETGSHKLTNEDEEVPASDVLITELSAQLDQALDTSTEEYDSDEAPKFVAGYRERLSSSLNEYNNKIDIIEQNQKKLQRITILADGLRHAFPRKKRSQKIMIDHSIEEEHKKYREEQIEIEADIEKLPRLQQVRDTLITQSNLHSEGKKSEKPNLMSPSTSSSSRFFEEPVTQVSCDEPLPLIKKIREQAVLALGEKYSKLNECYKNFSRETAGKTSALREDIKSIAEIFLVLREAILEGRKVTANEASFYQSYSTIFPEAMRKQVANFLPGNRVGPSL